MLDSNFNFALATPEILLLAFTCGILLVDAFVKDPSRWVTHALTQVALGITLVVSAMQWIQGVHGTTFHGMYVADNLSHFLKIGAYIATMVTLVYGASYSRSRNMLSRGGELYILALLCTLGQMVMISASSLISIYVGLELMSLSLYALVAMRREHTAATEAAMKYFVLGALASGILLYGMSMLYGATGTLSLSGIAEAIAAGEIEPMILIFGLVFIVAALGFKLGGAPFHMWLPDVYDGAPTQITLLVGTAPKLAAFAVAVRLLGEALPATAEYWQAMLMTLAVLSLIIGNLTAIMQTSFKRMLAYSTIAHMGFVLLGLLSGDDALTRAAGYGSAMFYMVFYVLTTLGTFGMILLLSRANGFEADNIDDMKGLNRRSPWFAAMLLLMMFSLAGIPPTVGFYAKLVVLQEVVSSGHVWLAVLAVMASLIGAFYYLRIVKLMYFDEPSQADAAAQIEAAPAARAVLSVNGALMLLLGILPGPLLAACIHAIMTTFA